MIERRAFVLAAVACAVAMGSTPATAASLWLDELTSVELRELIARRAAAVALNS